MVHEDMPPPRDAAERDARLRALPGGRRSWASLMTVLAIVASITVVLVVAGARTGEWAWFGLAVCSGTITVALGALLWAGRAARLASDAGGPTTARFAAWGALLLGAGVAFVLGALSESALGILCYLTAAGLAFWGRRLLQAG